MSSTVAMVDRITQAMVGGFDLATIYCGRKLGWFAGLAALETASSGELAAWAGTSERYTREWLETAAISGLIAVAEQAAGGDSRRYALLPGSEAVVCDTEGDVPELHDLMCAFASLVKVSDLVAHYRSGTGLPFADYGDDMRTSQALSTRRGYPECR